MLTPVQISTLAKGLSPFLMDPSSERNGHAFLDTCSAFAEEVGKVVSSSEREDSRINSDSVDRALEEVLDKINKDKVSISNQTKAYLERLTDQMQSAINVMPTLVDQEVKLMLKEHDTESLRQYLTHEVASSLMSILSLSDMLAEKLPQSHSSSQFRAFSLVSGLAARVGALFSSQNTAVSLPRWNSAGAVADYLVMKEIEQAKKAIAEGKLDLSMNESEFERKRP